MLCNGTDNTLHVTNDFQEQDWSTGYIASLNEINNILHLLPKDSVCSKLLEKSKKNKINKNTMKKLFLTQR